MSPNYVLQIRPPSAPSFDWKHHSDWRTATGSTQNALGDGGKWNAPASSSVLEVIAGSVVGWERTANVFNIKWFQTGLFGNIDRTIAGISDGQNWWHRAWWRVDPGWTTGQIMGHPHNVNVNPIQFVYANVVGQATGYRTEYRAFAHTEGGGQKIFSSPGTPSLLHNTWHRKEFFHEIVSWDEEEVLMRIYPYIYDDGEPGTLLYDADDYMSGAQSLTAWYNAGHSFRLTSVVDGLTAAQLARRYIYGNEDPNASGGPKNIYIGAVGAALEQIGTRLAA